MKEKTPTTATSDEDRPLQRIAAWTIMPLTMGVIMPASADGENSASQAKLNRRVHI